MVQKFRKKVYCFKFVNINKNNLFYIFDKKFNKNYLNWEHLYIIM